MSSIKYYLRPGDNATCTADVTLNDDHEFDVYDMLDLRALLADDGEGYKVYYDSDNLPYVDVDRDDLIKYSEEMAEGESENSGVPPCKCQECKNTIPQKWIKYSHTCPICGNKHGATNA